MGSACIIHSRCEAPSFGLNDSGICTGQEAVNWNHRELFREKVKKPLYSCH
jgi:hypothetical protein